MAEDSTQDRTEAATPHRMEEARGKGQVAVSSDLGQAGLLMVALGLLWILGPDVGETLRQLMHRDLLLSYQPEWTVSHTVMLAQQLASRLIKVVFPFTLVMAATALTLNVIQVGFRVTFDPLSPNWSRLDWTQGWQRLFSIRSLTRGVMLLLKMSLGLGVAAWFLYANQPQLHQLGLGGLLATIRATWFFALKSCFALAGTLLSIGVIDYLFQRWQFGQDLMMSKQEVRDEHKREEGDPQIKGRMRKMAREAMRLQMLRRVPEATVILTNPTHIAVALKYDRDNMQAPRVIAKGTDALAKRIARIAREHNIPVLERKPLARALYASVNVDQEIPPNLYRAIAEILAYIYGLKKSA